LPPNEKCRVYEKEANFLLKEAFPGLAELGL
jgi:hypothetical protein